MSPLLGSSGGSSEYAFRGTLDDWPDPFATTLAAQDQPAISPTSTLTATITVTGLNYKARVIANTQYNSNVKVRLVSEVDTTTGSGTVLIDPAIDSRGVFSYRRETDPPLLIRDQSVLEFLLEPTFGTIGDFLKTYNVDVTIGKRTGKWTVSTRAIDQTPDSFIFTPLIDQELGITTVSNTVTVVGLETGFSFPISVTANPGPAAEPGNVKYFKNSIEVIGIGTVATGDQIYLSTLTPSPPAYSSPRTFSVQVGTFTTSWAILTRPAVTTVNSFSFPGISSANVIGYGYTSQLIQILGADPSIALPVSITGLDATYQILKSDGTPRYPNPPAPPPYFSGISSVAFNGDFINVKVISGGYSGIKTGTLVVSDKSASFIVTTRPAPIDSVPDTFTFAAVIDQPRGDFVSSASTTLTGMTNVGLASITSPALPSTLDPQFQVERLVGGVPTVVKAFSNANANVQDKDIITLRLFTPSIPGSNGVSSSNMTLEISGTDTNAPIETDPPTKNPQGYQVNNLSRSYNWSATTIARTCNINSFTISNSTGVARNTLVDKSFTVSGFNTDCQMRVSIASTSTEYYFSSLNGVAIPPVPPTTVLNAVTPGSTIIASVRSDTIDYLSSIGSTITVSNSVPGVTPTVGFVTTFNVVTIGNTVATSISLQVLDPSTGLSIASTDTGKNMVLSWSSTNPQDASSIRSITGTNWTTLPSVSTGTSTIVSPTLAPTAGTTNFTYTISVWANPSAVNADPILAAAAGVTLLPQDTSPAGGGRRYATGTATISVTQDVTPIFSPTDFTPQFDVQISPAAPAAANISTSNTLSITDITADIFGSITIPSVGVRTATFDNGATNRTFSFPARAGVTTDKVIVRLSNSENYLGITTAIVTFRDSALNVVASKVFNVTTAACVPVIITDSSITDSDPITPNSVTLSAYNSVEYQSSTGAQTIFKTLYKGAAATDLGVITSFQGTATGYINRSATPLNRTPGVFSGGTTLSWRDFVTAVYDAYNLPANANRPPTISDVFSYLSVFPSSYLDLTAYRAAISSNVSGLVAGTPSTKRIVGGYIIDSTCRTNIPTV